MCSEGPQQELCWALGKTTSRLNVSKDVSQAESYAGRLVNTYGECLLAMAIRVVHQFLHVTSE